MVTLSQDEQRDQIQQLYQTGDWKGTLRFINSPECTLGGTLLWLQPDYSTLIWLSQILKQLQVDQLFSIGCGTGLLEWLLQCASGLNVIGVEFDRRWWLSRHSLGPFAPLLFIGDNQHPLSSCTNHSAILFCYFNDRDAFCSYLNAFYGRVCIIAGPGPDAGSTHCNPEPMHSDTQQILSKWRLSEARQVAQTLDWIAIYINNNEP